MRQRLVCAAVLIWLLPMAVSAQEGLRSSGPPEGGLGRTVQGDLYRVGPDFYTTLRERPPAVVVPLIVPFDPFGFWYADPHPRGGRRFTSSMAGRQGPSHRHGRRDAAPYDEPRRAQPRPPEPAPELPPVIPGVPKTFYVIPGCYAGDKPPQPEWLRPGCDPSRLRVIEP